MKKILLFIILFLIIVSILIFLPKRYPVLTYHDFTTGEPTSEMQKNIDDFEKEMKYLYKHHYKTLTLKDVECYFDNKCKLPRKSVLITMDDGWKNEYLLAFDILKKYNLNAVVFYVGENYEGNNDNFINKEDLQIIKTKYPNIEIAAHTYSNHTEDAFLKSVDELTEDFKKMDEIIDTKYFAYPYGRYSDNYIQSLKDNGYKLAFGFGPNKNHRKFDIHDNRYAIPRLNLSTTYPYYRFVLRMILPF